MGKSDKEIVDELIAAGELPSCCEVCKVDGKEKEAAAVFRVDISSDLVPVAGVKALNIGLCMGHLELMEAIPELGYRLADALVLRRMREHVGKN